MKIFIPLLALLTSCIYTVPPPQPVYYTGYNYYQYTPPQRDCTCGYVIDKGVDQYERYFMEVQNQCSGNVKRFTFDKKDWDTFKVSDGICMTQNSSW